MYRGDLDLPKSNRKREIVLTPPARDALLPLDRSSEWTFTAKRGGRLSQSGLAYYWRGIEGAFGRKVTPHELKHFAGLQRDPGAQGCRTVARAVARTR